MFSLQRIAAAVVRQECGRGSVSVIFVGPSRMRQLNKRYRGINRATDVLSFHSEEKGYLGDILLCRSYLRKQAQAAAVAYKEELARMTIHGALHLLGYDHMKPRDAKKMFGLQEEYLKKYYDISK